MSQNLNSLDVGPNLLCLMQGLRLRQQMVDARVFQFGLAFGPLAFLFGNSSPFRFLQLLLALNGPGMSAGSVVAEALFGKDDDGRGDFAQVPFEHVARFVFP
ncbi:MAG: hypothetical protein ABI051_04325 [Vicinamibacterales bacterium]